MKNKLGKSTGKNKWLRCGGGKVIAVQIKDKGWRTSQIKLIPEYKS